MLIQNFRPESRSQPGNFLSHRGWRRDHIRRRHGESWILIGKLFRRRYWRGNNLNRIRSGKTKVRNLALRRCGAGWNCSDIHIGSGTQLIGNLGGWSHHGRGHHRRTQRRPHAFRRGRAGKRLHGQQIGHGRIGLWQIEFRSIRHGLPRYASTRYADGLRGMVGLATASAAGAARLGSANVLRAR